MHLVKLLCYYVYYCLYFNSFLYKLLWKLVILFIHFVDFIFTVFNQMSYLIDSIIGKFKRKKMYDKEFTKKISGHFEDYTTMVNNFRIKIQNLDTSIINLIYREQNDKTIDIFTSTLCGFKYNDLIYYKKFMDAVLNDYDIDDKYKLHLFVKTDLEYFRKLIHELKCIKYEHISIINKLIYLHGITLDDILIIKEKSCNDVFIYFICVLLRNLCWWNHCMKREELHNFISSIYENMYTLDDFEYKYINNGYLYNKKFHENVLIGYIKNNLYYYSKSKINEYIEHLDNNLLKLMKHIIKKEIKRKFCKWFI